MRDKENLPDGFTALPNSLFDEWLPKLSDGELRVLLVAARSTLGWKEGAGRKERDWLSHSQLRKRTGRSSTPVSRAIDTLIRRGLLAVEDGEGRRLATAGERRAARTRLYFRLEGTLLGTALLALPEAPPPSRIQQVETTKETATKSSKEGVSFPFGGNVTLSDPTAGEESASPEVRSQVDANEGVRLFVERFQEAYRAARPGEPVPPAAPEDLLKLAAYLERGHAQTLERNLAAYFASAFGYAKRRRFSLGAYLDCVFVLSARNRSFERPGRTGAWAKP